MLTHARSLAVVLLVTLAHACVADGADEVTVAAVETAFDRYDVDWILEDDGTYVLRASVAIEAPPDVVWALVRDVNGYAEWSQSITAQVEELVPGATIDLAIQLFDPPLGMTRSTETVVVVDDEVRAVAWRRQFIFQQTTERWQVVVPEGEGSRYYTALKFPRLLGSIMKVTLGPRTLAAFETFAAELEAEAEETQNEI